MADCPKCGYHLKMTDWKQYCPGCKTNVVVYGLQERLMQDADIAEVQHYHFQKKMDNLKSSFVGTKPAIARIVTSVLPIAAVFLPLFKGKLGSPFEPFEGNISAINIYNGFSQLTGNLGTLTSGKEGTLLFVSVALLLVSLVLTLLHLILTILSCSPHAKQRNTVQGVLLLITTIGSAICISMAGGDIISGSLGIGAYLYIVLQLVNVGLDLYVTYKGMEIKHKQCFVGGIPVEEYLEMVEKGIPTEEIRAEQYKRLQQLQDEKIAKLKEEEEKKKNEENKEEEATENG